MRRHVLCGAILWLAMAVCAHAQAPAAEGDKQATIEGVVLDEIARTPIRKAEVQLFKTSADLVASAMNQTPDYTALTDAEGKFKLEKIEAGEYRVTVRRAGYVNAATSYGRGSARLKLAAGESHNGLRYTLVRQAVIVGRVIDDEGEPVQNARVSVMRFRTLRGARLLQIAQVAQTNDKGEYRLVAIHPGRYYIQAVPPQGLSASNKEGARAGLVATFYPNAVRAEEASVIDAHAGGELSAQDIALRRERVFTISGQVLNVDGTPVQQGFLSVTNLSSQIGGFTPPRPIREKGRFLIDNVHGGVYSLNVMMAGQSDGDVTRLYARTDVTVSDADVKDVVLRAQVGYETTGTMVVEGVEAGKADLSSSLITLSSTTGFLWETVQTPTKADGTFALRGFGPHQYMLTSYLQSSQFDAYLAAIYAGTENVYGREVSGAALASTPIRVVYRTDGAKVSGTVELPEDRSQMIAMPTVVLFPCDPLQRALDSVPTARVDDKGGFTLKAVRPGDYVAMAFDAIDSSLLHEPELYAVVERVGKRISLKANASESLTLKPQSAPEEFAHR